MGSKLLTDGTLHQAHASKPLASARLPPAHGCMHTLLVNCWLFHLQSEMEVHHKLVPLLTGGPLVKPDWPWWAPWTHQQFHSCLLTKSGPGNICQLFFFLYVRSQRPKQQIKREREIATPWSPCSYRPRSPYTKLGMPARTYSLSEFIVKIKKLNYSS